MSGDRRLLMLTVDDERGASTRYRVLAHRPHLEARGFRTTVRYPLGRPERMFRPAWRAADLAQDLLDPFIGLLFVHRKMYPPPVARRLRRAGRVVVFDIDDAVDLPPPGRQIEPATRDRYRRNFEATMNAADLVLCGNRELASRLPHERYELLPTPIDTGRFAPSDRRSSGAGRVGWVGHSDNLPYLEALGEPLREVARRHPGLRLVVVADRPPKLPGLEVEFRRWSLDTEVSCFDGLGVGLMPLEDTPWARGKCAFKAVQYMALGIPAVISPVGMNTEVVQDGRTGFLADAPEDWVRALDLLLSDPARAAQIGKAGREAVVRDYSLRVVSDRLATILESLS